MARAATTPEDLFAAGYAACFGGAVDAVARASHTSISNVEVRSTVKLTHENWKDFTLHVALDVIISGVSQQTADTLVAQAHQVCPYSRATRNNIEVTLTAHAA
jgi:Ohr subfamily peroxiredoxin